MSYVALYRKYRPNTFESIVGQENITKILKNQVKNDKISHAYIFSGSRGTGKTSAAKIFARAINCLKPQDGEPCNECSVCKSILDSSTTDVIEMDAASNNGVENIRQIRQEVVYSTMDVKYRVYIIDEAHMLTTAAFNALLKTLEEPPQNVIFILATTEQHKIPITILSRCLRFEFNRISEAAIKSRLEYVLNDLKVKYDEEAVKYISKLADGALRDGLSILDRCLSENQEKLELLNVQVIVGAIDQDLFNELVNSIQNYDAIQSLKTIDKILNKGKDLRELSYRLTEHFLNELVEAKDPGDKIRLQKIIEKLSKLDSDLRNTSMPVIVLKASMVEICNFSNELNGGNAVILSETQEDKDENIKYFNKKIQLLEQKVSELIKNMKNLASTDKKNLLDVKEIKENESNGSKTMSIEVPKAGIKQEEKPTNEGTDEIQQDQDGIVQSDEYKIFQFAQDFKKEFLNRGKTKIYSTLVNSDIYINDNNFIIKTENSFAYNQLKKEEAVLDLTKVLRDNYSIDLPVKVELSCSLNDKNINKIEEHFKKNNIEYTQID